MTGDGLPSPAGEGAFPEVSAPSAHADAGTHSPGSCLVPVRVRLQGFAPSCRISSPASFRPVKAGNAHGVLPFEAFPSRGAVAPLDARCLPAVSLPRRVVAQGHGRCTADAASRRCSPRESVTRKRCLVVLALDAPLGFSRPRACPSLRGSRLPGRSPRRLGRDPARTGRRPASQGLDPQRGSTSRRRRQPFRAFHTSFPLRLASRRVVPGLRRRTR